MPAPKLTLVTALAVALSLAAAAAENIEALLARSLQHTMHGRWNQASKELDAAIRRAHQSKDVRTEAALTAELGRVLAERNFFYRRGPQKALATFERAASLAEAAQDRKALADALHGQGRIHYSERLAGAGDWETSRALFDRAYQLRQKIGDKRGLAESLFFLGLVHQMKKEYEPAMERFQKSRALTLELGDQVQQSFADRHIGYIHEVRNELDQAERYYVSSLKLRQETGHEVGVPFALALLADFRAKHRGDADGAVELLQRAIASAEKCNSVRGKFLAEMALGRAYLEKKDAANARLYTARALAGAQAFGHQEAVDEARQQLAEIGAAKPQGN